MKLVVITVCYNDLAGLKKTIESLVPYQKNIINQLVIDGNSKDGTKEYLAEVSKGSTIKYISEPDAGIFDAMNKGIALATGDYIGILNSDELGLFSRSLISY